MACVYCRLFGKEELMKAKTSRSRNTICRSKRRIDPKLQESLHLALDALLSALVAVDAVPRKQPPESTNAALLADPKCRASSRACIETWERLKAVLPDQDAVRRALAFEAAYGAKEVAATAVGWRLGVLAGGRVQKKDR